MRFDHPPSSDPPFVTIVYFIMSCFLSVKKEDREHSRVIIIIIIKY